MAKAVTGEKVRLGVVGCGLITQLAHLPALRALDGRFEVVAVADPSERVRSAVARRNGVPGAYASHADMMDRVTLDAILVAAPNGAHAGVTLDALDAGLHVLVEKPLCLSPQDATRIVELAAAHKRVVQVGYMKRFDPSYEALRAPAGLQLVTTTTVDPGIGERYRPADFVDATDVPESSRQALRLTTEQQVASALGSDDPCHIRPFSDAFLGALVHDVNLVRGLVADPAPRVTDAAHAPDGSLAYGAFTIADAVRWTAAWMLLRGAPRFREELRLFGSDGLGGCTFPAPYERAPARNYARQLAHFYDCVTAGVPCRTPAEQGAADVVLLTELYRAAVAA